MADIAKSPEPSDLIFVFAGREGRKRHGLSLYRQGYAPRIVFSVGRFEWRRFAALGLPGDGGLVELVPTIAAGRRHFFVHVEGESVRAEAVRPGLLGTLGEARALALRLERREAIKLLVVTSSQHLRRAVLSLRTFLPRRVTIVPVASPETADERDSLLTERVKLLGYGLLAPFYRACAVRRFLL